MTLKLKTVGQQWRVPCRIRVRHTHTSTHTPQGSKKTQFTIQIILWWQSNSFQFKYWLNSPVAFCCHPPCILRVCLSVCVWTELNPELLYLQSKIKFLPPCFEYQYLIWVIVSKTEYNLHKHYQSKAASLMLMNIICSFNWPYCRVKENPHPPEVNVNVWKATGIIACLVSCCKSEIVSYSAVQGLQMKN